MYHYNPLYAITSCLTQQLCPFTATASASFGECHHKRLPMYGYPPRDDIISESGAWNRTKETTDANQQIGLRPTVSTLIASVTMSTVGTPKKVVTASLSDKPAATVLEAPACEVWSSYVSLLHYIVTYCHYIHLHDQSWIWGLCLDGLLICPNLAELPKSRVPQAGLPMHWTSGGVTKAPKVPLRVEQNAEQVMFTSSYSCRTWYVLVFLLTAILSWGFPEVSDCLKGIDTPLYGLPPEHSLSPNVAQMPSSGWVCFCRRSVSSLTQPMPFADLPFETFETKWTKGIQENSSLCSCGARFRTSDQLHSSTFEVKNSKKVSMCQCVNVS